MKTEAKESPRTGRNRSKKSLLMNSYKDSPMRMLRGAEFQALNLKLSNNSAVEDVSKLSPFQQNYI